MTLPDGYEVRYHEERQQPWTLLRRRNAPSNDRHTGWARHWAVEQFCYAEDEAQAYAEAQLRRRQAGLPAHALGSTYRDLRA